MTIFRDGEGTWEAFYKFAPHVFYNKELIGRFVVFHIQDSLQLVANCEILHLISTCTIITIVLIPLPLLLKEFTLTQFQSVKPSLSSQVLVFHCFSWMVLDYVHFCWDSLGQVQYYVCVVCVDQVFSVRDLSKANNTIISVQEISRKLIHISHTPIMQAHVIQVISNDFIAIIGNNQFILVSMATEWHILF